MKIFIAVLALLVTASVGFSQIIIRGTVHACDGSKPMIADAHLGHMHESTDKSINVQCDKQGAFTMTVPAPGIYNLRVSAASHEEVSIPLMITDAKKTITLDVTLKGDNYDPIPERVVIIGDWNKFEFSGTDTLAPLTRNGNTVFVGTRIATGDTLAYQLLGVAGSHSVNGSQADYMTYDGGGDYRSVLRTAKDQAVTITYDPWAMYVHSQQNLPKVTFVNDDFLTHAYELSSKLDEMQAAAIEHPSDGPAYLSKEKYHALQAFAKDNMKSAITSSDHEFAKFAAVKYASMYNESFPLSEDDAAMILNTVPARSAYWVIAPREVIALCDEVSPALGIAYRKALESNPEKAVRAIAYADELERVYTAGQTDDARRIYTKLKTDYNDVSDISYEIAKFNPDAAVQIGKSVPSFELTLLDAAATKVSNTSMLGKYYMMDFWATWCGPCVREMPTLHKAYSTFKGRKGFDILSISMDGSQSQIAPFQQHKWHMPWLNAFIPGVFNAELAKRFEVAGIPRPILVGPDGKIVAMEDQLRGENLEKTLVKFLGQAN